MKMTKAVIPEYETNLKLKRIMKATLYTLAFALVLGITVGLLQSMKTPRPIPTVTTPQREGAEPVAARGPSAIPSKRLPSAARVEAPVRAAASRESSARPGLPLENQKLAAICDPQTSFAQRQSLWNDLVAAGKMDWAIEQLEEAVQGPGADPQVTASLGQAYLLKAGSIKDIREQGILGMKADQTFDLALANDPSNWDARYWKATAMSYWPPQLNKGNEVMEQFVTLIQQQEATAPQPHFAQSYAALGDVYVKYGHKDHAQEIWKRGLTTFPGNPVLTEKLAGLAGQ